MKIKTQITLIALLLVMSSCNSSKNSITGLWHITDVQAGDLEMTPVAKWTRINSDGTYESGNGWLKNSEGRWTFNESENAFLPVETNGLDDPYGPFAVRFIPDENTNPMTWSREEEGMIVEVMLERIDELPMAPTDDIQGLWDLTRVKVDGADSTDTIDPYNQHYIFIKWDRTYLERTAAGDRQTGYWHMNGHHPEFTFLPHTSGKEQTSWTVKIDEGKTLVMSSVSDENGEIIRTFTRTSSFPD